MFTSYVYLEPISKNDLFIEAFVILLSMSDIEFAFFTACVCKKSRKGSLPLTEIQVDIKPPILQNNVYAKAASELVEGG